jgi:beta-galactosidase
MVIAMAGRRIGQQIAGVVVMAMAIALAGCGHGRKASPAVGPDSSREMTGAAGPAEAGTLVGGAGGAGGADGPGSGGGGPAGYTAPASARQEVSLDEGWRFIRADAPGAEGRDFDDRAWTAVTLPHTWNAQDGQDGGNDYYRGPGWYRRRYTVPAAHAGRRLFLQFEGANIVTDVWVDGTHVGQHRGGFATFRFDVTSLLEAGKESLIAVRVSNAPVADVPSLSADFTFFGGLYRDVRLLVTDAVHLDVEDFASSGVYLTPGQVSAASADLQARIRVKNSEAAPRLVAVDAVVVRPDRSVAARLTGSQMVGAGATAELKLDGRIDHPHLWNGRLDPYLHSVYVELRDAGGGAVRDLVVQPLGFRSFAVSAATGFQLNGQPYDLHGVNRHQDRQDQGWAITAAQQKEDLSLIMEMGATAIRLAHYQHAQSFYDLCDGAGLVVWAEMGMVNGITPGEPFASNARQQLTELIRQSYNHPAIVFWSLANELVETPDPNPLLAALNDLAHAEDPSRLTTLATHRDDANPINWHTDTVGFNKYYGWYSGTLAAAATWADRAHAVYPDRRIAMSEYGAGAGLRFHSATPVVNDHSEEYQALFHESYWKTLAARPFLWGKFIWAMFDFASDGRAEGDNPGRNDKGMVTYDRRVKKDAFFWYKASWSAEPFVHITGRRWDPRPQSPIDIKVYSNTPTVTLTVNGRPLPPRTSSDHIFVWPAVPLQPGPNLVEATATQAGAIYRDAVTWKL